MKKKVKIFSEISKEDSETSIGDIEEKINRFLEENPNIEIEDRLMCYSNNYRSTPTIIISIFYKELKVSQPLM